MTPLSWGTSTGALAGTADYDVFGAVRARSGATSLFGYAGEQADAATGFTYLRARYLHPSLGRFLSADSVQPNAPGSQGYNLYAYVANNPTTWVDPSGHSALALMPACLATPWCASVVQLGLSRIAMGGFAAIGGWVTVIIALVACALDVYLEIEQGRSVFGGCFGLARQFQNVIDAFGSNAPEGVFTGTSEQTRDAANSYPSLPSAERPGAPILQAQTNWPNTLPKSGDYPYIPPKGIPEGRVEKDRQGQYVDRDGNRWRWDPRKQEWDVQHRDGTHTNIDINGKRTHGPDNFPRKPQ